MKMNRFASNEFASNESKLTIDAYSIGMYLLAQGNDYLITKSNIAKHFKIGKSRIDRIFQELVDKGHIIKKVIPRTKEDQSGVKWFFYENVNDSLKMTSKTV